MRTAQRGCALLRRRHSIRVEQTSVRTGGERDGRWRGSGGEGGRMPRRRAAGKRSRPLQSRMGASGERAADTTEHSAADLVSPRSPLNSRLAMDRDSGCEMRYGDAARRLKPTPVARPQASAENRANLTFGHSSVKDSNPETWQRGRGVGAAGHLQFRHEHGRIRLGHHPRPPDLPPPVGISCPRHRPNRRHGLGAGSPAPK